MEKIRATHKRIINAIAAVHMLENAPINLITITKYSSKICSNLGQLLKEIFGDTIELNAIYSGDLLQHICAKVKQNGKYYDIESGLITQGLDADEMLCNWRATHLAPIDDVTKTNGFSKRIWENETKHYIPEVHAWVLSQIKPPVKKAGILKCAECPYKN